MKLLNPNDPVNTLRTTTIGTACVDVLIRDGELWLTRKGMAAALMVSEKTVIRYLRGIQNEQPDREITTQVIRVVNREGKRNVIRKVAFFNIFTYLCLHYRIKKKKARAARVGSDSAACSCEV